MSNSDRKERVICPFFKTVYRRSIVCEAMVGQEMALRFRTPEKRRSYQESICSSWEYGMCPYAGLLQEIYEEDIK